MKSELTILIIVTAGYLIWAFWYHRHDKSLTLPIFLEYLLMAALSLVMLLAVFSS